MRVVERLRTQLASAAMQVQRHLAALGVERGDRVALSITEWALMPALYWHCGCGCDLCSVESTVVGC